ncbi:hypothetical protein CR513_36257, partial [Mucuna pruriens]
MFNTWGDMKHMFLEKFFPASNRPSERKYVESGNTQWKHCMNIERRSTSCVPRVRTTKSANNFYCRLLMMDQNMVDVTSGGALMDKTPKIARHLISNMARGTSTSRVVSEVGSFDNLRLDNQLTKLTSLVRQLTVGQHQ